jgi:ribosome recycling factor
MKHFGIVIMAIIAMMLQPFSSDAKKDDLLRDAERRMKEVIIILKKDYYSIKPDNSRISPKHKREGGKNTQIKLVRDLAEEAKTKIRNINKEFMERNRKSSKEGAGSEEESKRTVDDIQKLTDKYIEELNKLLEKKEKEVLEV